MSNSYKQTAVGRIPKEWEVVRLGDVFQRVTRKNTVNSDNVLTISAQNGLIKQENFFTKSVASKDLSNYILLEKGEFAYNKSYSSGYPMGATKRLNFYNYGVLSNLYIYFKIKNGNSDFYEQYFEAGLLNKEIHQIAQEGARNHGLLNISVVDFFNILIVLPPLKEQEKIAEILSTCDKVISNLDELIKAKTNLKTALMQNLLSAKIRFKEFTDPWQEKFGDKLFKTITEINQNYDLPILAISQEFGAIPRNLIDYKVIVSYKSISNYKVVRKGNFIISLRSFQGGIEYSKYDGICSPAYIILKPIQQIFDNFFKYYFKSHDYIQKLNSKLEGIRDGKMVSFKQFSEIKIPLPNLAEQQKITEVLSACDDEINLLKDKLSNLKLQKQGLMQNLLTGKVRVRV